MNTIRFPLFNLEILINPIAFSIFGIDIYWYAILIVLSMIMGIIILKIRDGIFGIKFDNVVDLLVILIPTAIISARLYYIIFNFKYFAENPTQIFNFRTGGMAIYGGIIGSLIVILLFCKRKKIVFLDLLDFIVPALALRASNRQMGELHKRRSIWN